MVCRAHFYLRVDTYHYWMEIVALHTSPRLKTGLFVPLREVYIDYYITSACKPWKAMLDKGWRELCYNKQRVVHMVTQVWFV